MEQPGVGSSPRARGTRGVGVYPDWHPRFIPAGAGNTRLNTLPRLLFPVHPRGRGEHVEIVRDIVCAVGSSPRARGTRRRTQNFIIMNRFIPAGAGNTIEQVAMGKTVTVHPRGRGEHCVS